MTDKVRDALAFRALTFKDALERPHYSDLGLGVLVPRASRALCGNEEGASLYRASKGSPCLFLRA